MIEFIMQKMKMQSKIKGFMLAETMLGLIVTAFAVVIMQNLVFQLKTGAQSNFKDDQLAFAYVQLDRFLKGGKEEQVSLAPEESNTKRAVFYKVNISQKKKPQQKYIIQQYKNMIRVTTPESGHMPLVLRVERAKFETGKNFIEINVNGQDGRRSELRWQVENEKDKNKKEEN